MKVTMKIGGRVYNNKKIGQIEIKPPEYLMWSRVSMLGLRPPCKAKIWLSTRAVRGR